jgi:hypothetical protein
VIDDALVQQICLEILKIIVAGVSTAAEGAAEELQAENCQDDQTVYPIDIETGAFARVFGII